MTPKDTLNAIIQSIAIEHKLDVKKEFRGIAKRQFRFDYAITKLKIAIEYEGIMSKKSRHTTPKGFTTDCDKYNLAAVNGWVVLRFTVINLPSAHEIINLVVNNRIILLKIADLDQLF
jgi:hypothetical protein